MNVFETVIVFTPKKKKDETQEVASILVGPKAFLAKDHEQAKTLAAFEVPEAYRTRLDEVEIKVRPF